MLQKFIIALLSLTLAAVCGAWGYSAWSRGTVALVVTPAGASAPVPVAEAAPKPVARFAAANSASGADFSYEYVAPRSAALLPVYERVRDADLLRKLPEIDTLDGLLVLPRPLRYVTAECKSADAFYLSAKGEVVLCYETLQVLHEQGQALGRDNKLGDEFARQYVLANTRFIVAHETGHALIDQLDLAITGREEDAVDQLATTLMQRFARADESPQQVAENLRMAGNWFLARAQGQYNLDAYADEHALGEQRYFNLQCLIYGGNPARFVNIVTDGDLPEARAQKCPDEARRAGRSWLRLLLPHVAPKYAMTEAKANRFFMQQEHARARNAEGPYLR
ncbi:DUF4344 domain-containing metallopeptidase [Lysobacter koreensis]|uniref:DUF4344 domain-containing metallopeptidase n=1 Tax=Lysobacter koreensis TaxID=266122 RepID=A0ABW2YSY6_9GAMM